MFTVLNGIKPISDEALKLVKHSMCFFMSTFFVCIHYKTVIFIAVGDADDKWKTLNEIRYSPTSTKMIRRCKEYLGINDNK